MRSYLRHWVCLSLTLLPLVAFAENSYSNAPTRIPTRYVIPVTTTKPVYLYSFVESAFQVLPLRKIWTRQPDPCTKKLVMVPISINHIICSHAQANKIDPLIIQLLARHESGFSPDATSSAGARGLMQLMPETASSLGVTDIYDPAQNIYAGTRYLAQQYARYGELQLALAAYNAGPSAVDNYGGIPPYAETQNYVTSITSEYVRYRRKLSR